MDRVKDKVVIVTGAGDGIGKAIAKMYAKEGAKVAVTDIAIEKGKNTAEEIKAEGGIAEFWELNVSNEAECKYVTELVLAKWGRIDVLVNNAGLVGIDKPTHEFEDKDWDKVFSVDVKGVFYMTKYCVPGMMENRKGAIINMSSIDGLVGVDELPAYCAAKGAVTMMTKHDAVAYAPYNIRVNSIHPGTIMTPLMQDVVDQNPGYLEMDLKRYPIGYFGEPDDVAYAALYLGSDEAKFVVGAQLVVDGGFTVQ